MARATWNGVVLAETDRPVLREGNVYFPPEAVHHEHMTRTRARSGCRGTGLARSEAGGGGVRGGVAGSAAAEPVQVVAGGAIGVLGGRGAFPAPGEIRVGGGVLGARRFVTAPGSRPAIPPVPGLADADYLTNETIFGLDSGLGERPGRLAVLGGGAVGCELAQAFARLGRQVMVIEPAPRLLPAADPAASEVVEEACRAPGVALRTGA